MALESELREGCNRTFRTIDSFSAQMMSLLNEVLDFEKLESGKTQIVESKCQLETFISDTFSRAKSLLLSKKISLNAVLPANLPTFVYFDEHRFQQIMTNLISNAYKFTPENGEVDISFSVFEHLLDQDIVNLSFRIQDSGPGIPSEKLEDIFKPYVQSTEEHMKFGSGLGLAIVQKLVDMMDGSISVESENQNGSTFTVTIPVRIQKDREEKCSPSFSNYVTLDIFDAGEVSKNTTLIIDSETDEETVKNAVVAQCLFSRPPSIKDETAPLLPSQQNVLIVDDSPINRHILKKMLNKVCPDCLISEACDGIDAIEQVQSQHFDLIFMDIVMPRMDGYEAAKRIREFNKTSKILVTTANNIFDQASMAKQRESGVTGALGKPFTMDSLRTTLFELGFLRET